MSVARYYQWNGRAVTAEEFAALVSDLLASGYTLRPPPVVADRADLRGGMVVEHVPECNDGCEGDAHLLRAGR